MEINVRIILSDKNTPFPNTFWSDLQSAKDLQDCLKTSKDMDCIQMIKEHYGYKNYIILAHHKKQ